MQAHGLVDAYERCSPDEQAYSWIGRTGDGYRYDYFHVGQDLAERIRVCAYLHETRATAHGSRSGQSDGGRGRRQTARDNHPSGDDQEALF